MVFNKTNDKIMNIVYIISLVFLLRIPFVTDHVGRINLLFNIGTAIVLMLFFLVEISEKENISTVTITIFLLEAVLLISTMINGENIKAAFYYVIQEVALCLLASYGLRKDKEHFLKCLYAYSFFLILINFISMIIFPKGIDGNYNWILGYKNRIIVYILPTLYVRFILDECKYTKSFWILFIISAMSIIISHSSTSYVGLFILVAFFLFGRLLKKVKINPFILTIFCLLSFFMIVVFRLQYVFGFFIENLLHKSINFTNRTIVWDLAIKFIKSKPLLGYGYILPVDKVKLYRYTSFTHAHNQILELLFQGGALYLVLVGVFLLKVLKSVHNSQDNKLANFSTIIIFCYMVMMLTEYYNTTYIFYVGIIIYFLNKDRRKIDEEK